MTTEMRAGEPYNRKQICKPKNNLKLVSAPEASRRHPPPGDGPNARHRVRLTFSPNAHSSYYVLEAAWGSLVPLFGEHSERHEKDGLSIIGAVLDGNGRSDDVASCTDLLIYDIDGSATLAEVDALIEGSGLEALLWTTHNHKSIASEVGCGAYRRWAQKNGHPETPTDDNIRDFLKSNKRTKHYRDVKLLHGGKPKKVRQRRKLVEVYKFEHAPVDKVRIVIPLAQTLWINGADGVGIDGFHRIYMTGGEALFGDCFDTTCKNPSRLHYLASHRQGAEFCVRYYQGALLDWRPYWTPEVVAAVAEERQQREGQRREWEDSPPTDVEDLHRCLKSIPADLPYDDWFRCIGAVHHESKGSEAGRNLVHTWSEGDHRYDPDEVDNIWEYFERNVGGDTRRATMGTLIKLAREHDASFINPTRLEVIDLSLLKEFVL